ncbi:MAG: response regulator transcription factor [Verrucomicrobiota bacterium]
MSSSRVFLIDDQGAVLDMLCRVMREAGIEVAGVARSGAEAVSAVLSTRPDLVVVDLSMPDQTGFDVVTELRASGAPCRFLAFTGVTSIHAIERIWDTRFDGIVSKMSPLNELLDAVRSVLSGQVYVCRLFAEVRREQRRRPDNPSRVLTAREVQVLSLIGEARADGEIAELLQLSSTTVQGVRTRLINKLGLNGTPQLVRFANEHGYTEFAKDRGLRGV